MERVVERAATGEERKKEGESGDVKELEMK